MSLSRSANRALPLVLRHSIRSSGRTQLNVAAIAILIPKHRLSTDTSSARSSGNATPPPGFDIDKAKKPLPTSSTKIPDQHQIPRNSPTALPKGEAAEARSLSELAAEKSAPEKSDEKGLKKKEEEKKLTIWQKVKHEVNHYWDGTKLLATEVKISFSLALKMAAGYELTRRENRQLQRTVQDLGRLIPFSVFVIVPFAELLLPVALRLFPNLLPSTYESAKDREKKATKLRSSRKDVSAFLRQTMKETGLPVSVPTSQREEFIDFFRKINTTGETPTKADVIKVCRLFKDDLTLDNLSRPQLIAICRYLNLQTFGPDTFLRYQVRHQMRQIKRDDKAISYEGVDSLSVPELQMACASRGLRTQGVSPGRLRDDLQMWLDLRLKYGVPSTLLVLSNAFMYAQGKENEFNSQVDALQAVLASIPEELFHEIELEVHTAEGAATNKQRLEVLKEQQELIEDENKENEDHQKHGRANPKDDENIDEKEEKEEAVEKKDAAISKDAAEAELDFAAAEKNEKQQQHQKQT